MKKKCQKCNGSGKVKCEACPGTGRQTSLVTGDVGKCNYCDGGKKDCNKCGGRGEV